MQDKLTKAQRQAAYAKNTGYAAQAKYDSTNTTVITLKFNKNTEPDLISRLQSVDNKSGYIKGLIRDDIKNETA